MKTPEEMAKEALKGVPVDSEWGNGCYNGFLAGYKAAQKDAAIEIEHLKGSIEALREVRVLLRQDFETYRRTKTK